MHGKAHRRNARSRGGNHVDEQFRGATQPGAEMRHRENELSYKGHTADALALRVDEGRDKLRKCLGSRK